MHSAQYQVELLLKLLSTPLGLLSVVTILLLLVLTLLIPKMKWVVLALSFFASTLVVTDFIGRQRLMFPLEQLSNQGRGLTTSLMVIALIGALMVPGQGRRKYFVAGFLFFFIFQLTIAFNLTLRSDFSRGAGGMLLFMLQFFLFGLAIPNALKSHDDVVDYVRAIAGFGVIFAGINLLQFLVNPHAVAAVRFSGTSANQQGTGIFSAMGLLPICYLIVRSGRARVERIVYSAAAAMLIIMVLWSGSRTGVILAIAGLALLFRTRLSRIAGAGIVITLFIVLASTWIFPAVQFISPHLFSRTDTRSNVWSGLISQFIHYPITGLLLADQNGYGENSYLSIAASYGIIGLIPFLLAFFFIFRALRQLLRYRALFQDTLVVDLVLASFVQWALGGIFEAYMLGILNTAQILNFAYYPILAYLLEAAETAPAMLEGDVFSVPTEHFEPAPFPAGSW
jgi:hypothetical protein